MAKKSDPKPAEAVRILAPVELPEFSMVLRPGQKVRLSPAMQADERLKGKFEKV